MAKQAVSLLKLVPAAAGERHFMKVATTPIKSATDSFLVKDNGIFTAQNAVKAFDRKKNHFGNDEAASIRQYDESVVDESLYEERKKNAHKKKVKKRHVFVNGQWKGVASQAHNNKEAKRDAKTVYGKGKLEVVKEATPNFDTPEMNGFHNDLKSWFNKKKKKNQENPNDTNDTGGANAGAIGEEIVNEISTALLTKYIKKSSSDMAQRAYAYGAAVGRHKGRKDYPQRDDKINNRRAGVARATDKLKDRSIVEDKQHSTFAYKTDMHYRKWKDGYDKMKAAKAEKADKAKVEDKQNSTFAYKTDMHYRKWKDGYDKAKKVPQVHEAQVDLVKTIIIEECAFKKLKNKIKKKEGYSDEAAAATAAKIGREKLGKKAFEKKAEEGRKK